MDAGTPRILTLICTTVAIAPVATAGIIGPTGACCLDPMNCVEVTEGDCLAAFGTYLGDFTSCSTQVITFTAMQAPGAQHILLYPAQCPTGPIFVCDPALPLVSATITPPDGQTFIDFGGPSQPPIPPGFFEPGSEPFGGPIQFFGQPVGPGPFGDFGAADTLILRSDDPFDRCDLPSPGQQTVDIQIVDLNLQSISPITVVVNGQDTLWDVRVDLSQFQPPATPLTATKDHCNGGTYTSGLNVQPRFTFTKVLGPGAPAGHQEVLDTGIEGIPPIQFQIPSAPWVHDIDPFLGVEDPVCSGFHPGIGETNPVTDPGLCIVIVLGDLDGDGNVGFLDLNLLLAKWGPCPGCPEDIDGDGNVGFTDLNILLNNWGQSCP